MIVDFLIGVLASIVGGIILLKMLKLSTPLSIYIVRKAVQRYIPEKFRDETETEWLTHVEDKKDGKLFAALQLYFVGARKVGYLLVEKEQSTVNKEQEIEGGPERGRADAFILNLILFVPLMVTLENILAYESGSISRIFLLFLTLFWLACFIYIIKIRKEMKKAS